MEVRFRSSSVIRSPAKAAGSKKGVRKDFSLGDKLRDRVRDKRDLFFQAEACAQ